MAKKSEKKKKVLFVATVDSHIELFHLPFLKMFRDKGWEVHVATETDKPIKYCDKKICLTIKRSPFKFLSNIRAVMALRKIAREEKYNIVHCHTPMGGVVARLACRKMRREGLRMIYTAHGFHFYTGAPLHYWLMFYPVEWYLAKYTDTLITINNEDYERAQAKFGRRCRDIQYVPGVGVDEKKFEKKMSASEKRDLRESLGLKDEDKVLICVGRLDKNKNQGFLIKAMPELLEHDDKYHLLLVGPDELNGKYQKLAEKLGVSDNVHFLGYRDDIPELMQISNVAVSASKREGLPVNLIEAGMVGLPIVATECRGNRDICEKTGGVAVECDAKAFSRVIERAMQKYYSRRMKPNGIKEMSFAIIEKRMGEIYYRKKRVLHLLASNKFSGAENVACMIIRNLPNEYGMAYCSPRGDIEKKLNEMNIKYYPIDKLNHKFVKKVTEDFNPDVIHAHDFRASLIASRFWKKYIIISQLHKNDPGMKVISIKSLLYCIITKRINKIVGVSDSIYNEYIFRNRIKHKYITVFNYVDKEEIIRKAKEIKVNKQYDIFFFGRLSPEKDPLRFIDIIKQIGIPSIQCIMIGDGLLLDECRKKVKALGLQRNIEIVGYKNNPLPYVVNSGIGILPSKYEGFGITTIESLILSKPVFNSGVGGLAEIFERNKYFICKDTDEYIEKVLNYKKLPKKVFSDLCSVYTDKNKWCSKIRSFYGQ